MRRATGRDDLWSLGLSMSAGDSPCGHRLHARPDAAAVMAELDRWFEDYNEIHPRRALGMRSLRQFIRAHQPANLSGLTGQLQPPDSR